MLLFFFYYLEMFCWEVPKGFIKFARQNFVVMCLRIFSIQRENQSTRSSTNARQTKHKQETDCQSLGLRQTPHKQANMETEC